jgi:hypothetical protein
MRLPQRAGIDTEAWLPWQGTPPDCEFCSDCKAGFCGVFGACHILEFCVTGSNLAAKVWSRTNFSIKSGIFALSNGAA